MPVRFTCIGDQSHRDQIGLFLKGLGKKISYKSSPNVMYLLVNFEKVPIQGKTAMANFLATFGKIGLLFIPLSGHTDLTIPSN